MATSDPAMSPPHEGSTTGILQPVLVSSVTRNDRNPRQTFNPKAIERLAASMEEIGLQVPITVYQKDDGYILLDGERRFRAANLINWKHIPALVVRPPSSNENAVRMFNIHMLREEWEDIETAWALEQIMAETGVTVDRDLQKMTGLTIDRIRNMKRVLSYPRDVQERVASGDLKYQLLVEIDKNVSSKFRREGDIKFEGVTEPDARRILIDRYESSKEADVVDLRLVGTLFDTARSEGKVGDRARSALNKLFTDDSISIDDAYEIGAAANVELGKLVRDIASLPSRIGDFLAITNDTDQRNQLEEALTFHSKRILALLDELK